MLVEEHYNPELNEKIFCIETSILVKLMVILCVHRMFADKNDPKIIRDLAVIL